MTLLLGSRPLLANAALRLSRFYATGKAQPRTLPAVNTNTNRSGDQVSTDVKPIGERIKENTKTASYTGVIVVGFSVTAYLLYAIFKELFATGSSTSVYTKALEQCKNDPRIQDSLGTPIKGFGEESRRGRRQRVAHTNFQRNGVNHMRMQFYIQGIRNRATVHLEVAENSAGSFDYRYLFVQLDNYPKTTIILEDNRTLEVESNSSLL